jgi:predicted N-acetyltransferase YhbS
MQRRHVDENRPQDASPTTRAPALSAYRLAPRRRHLLLHFLWWPPSRLRDSLSTSLFGTLDLMSSSSFKIRLETDGDAQVLSELSAQAFGPGRFTRSAYRVREGVPPVGALCLCGLLDERLVGGIRFTAIRIGGEEGAALLGPLVVDPVEKGKGFGRALVEEGLARARAEGFGLVLLVGDMPYYGRFGFQPVPPGQITLPGPVDSARLLALELIPGALAAGGQVKGYAR